MRERTIVLLLAASSALLILNPSRATNVAALKAESQAASVNVITGPPAGWTTPVNISNLSGESGLPTIAVDDNGKAYVCWEEWYGGVGDPRAMCFNTNYAGAWGTSQQNYLYYDSIDDVGFPTIACDPSDGTAYLAYHDGDIPNQNMEVMFKEYSKGVKTWEGWVSLTPNPSDYSTLAVNPVDRTVYCMWFDDISGQVVWELLYRWRNPTTKQWSGLLTVPVFLGRSKYWRDMVIDKNGTAHLAFILRSPTEVWYTKNPTPQNANTWTTPVPISGNTDRDWAMPRIATDKDGEAYIVWHANTGGYESATEEVYFRKTLNGVWQAAENLSNSPTRSEGEVIAVDPDTKDIYVVWNELVDPSIGNWEVYFRTYASQTPGAPKSWGNIYNMTNDPYHSAEPFIRMDGKKGLHLVYHDFVGENREIFYMYKTGISITVTSPAGGESWEGLRTYPITWTTIGTATNVKIEDSTDGGATYATVVASTPNTGSYSWTVPNTPSTNCLVRISETTTGSPSGVSGAKFTITAPSVFPPINLALSTALNTARDRKTTTLTWAANPQNAGITVANYKIYRKPASAADSVYVVMASVASTATQYADTDLDILTKYAYRVTSVSSLGGESVPTATATETQKFEFAPVSVDVATIINRVLFNQIKENTVMFAPSPYNPDADVAGYDVYRRKANESDSALAFIKALDAATFSYKDAGLKGGQKYAYALKTRYTDGRVSDLSKVVSEK